MIRRLIVLSALSIIAFAPAAYAGHAEELDGCDHGATSVPCRPDPSPNGQDCDVHGNHGGVNEDHCSDDTEVTPSTSTTTPAPTTTTTSATSSTVAPTTTSTTASSSSTPPADPAAPTATATAPTSATPGSSELPRTGFGSTLLVILGLWFLLGGIVSLLAGAWLGR